MVLKPLNIRPPWYVLLDYFTTRPSFNNLSVAFLTKSHWDDQPDFKIPRKNSSPHSSVAPQDEFGNNDLYLHYINCKDLQRSLYRGDISVDYLQTTTRDALQQPKRCTKGHLLRYNCCSLKRVQSYSNSDITSIHTWVDQNPKPLFTLQILTRKSCIRGILDVGFNPQKVPPCFDHIYSSADALLSDK